MISRMCGGKRRSFTKLGALPVAEYMTTDIASLQGERHAVRCAATDRGKPPAVDSGAAGRKGSSASSPAPISSACSSTIPATFPASCSEAMNGPRWNGPATSAASSPRSCRGRSSSCCGRSVNQQPVWAAAPTWPGGFVRDLLLHVKNTDIDIVIEGDGIRLCQVPGRQTPRHCPPSYEKFGTATVIFSRPDANRRGHGPTRVLRASGGQAHGGKQLDQAGPLPPRFPPSTPWPFISTPGRFACPGRLLQLPERSQGTAHSGSAQSQLCRGSHPHLPCHPF